MKEQKRKFLGVWIPREVWLNEQLSLVEKAMLVEINSLDNKDGCWAGNQYFADFFKVTPRMIKNYVASLRDKGFIDVQLIGRTKRIITMREGNFPHEGKKVPSNEGKKLHHNNTEINNTDINISDFAKSQGKLINDLIDLFQIVNPSWGQLFKNKNQRKAVERLDAQYGEKLPKIIEFLKIYNSMPFNGTAIITPIELENKMGKVIAFAHQERAKQQKKGKEIIGL